ncbi:hypothetical protein Tco_1433759 [Tanacetum coccineum]
MILKCFRDASSLRVNLAKSKLYGIGVNSEEVNRADVILNSGFDSLPFIYLGLPKEVRVFHGSSGAKFALIKVLGFGGWLSMNLGLLGKWRWRFLNEQEALWRKVISVLYDNDGGLQNISGVGLKKGIWDGIVSSSLAIDDTGVAFSHSFIKKDSDGDTTLFWEDLWDAYSKVGRVRGLPPRLGACRPCLITSSLYTFIYHFG